MKRSSRGRQSSRRPAPIKLRAAFKKPVEVAHKAQPPKVARPRPIHPRRILPRVREGVERAFHSTTPRAVLRPALITPRLAMGDDLAIVLQSTLGAPGQQDFASNVGEPSLAMNGEIVLYTGNWYAAVSVDGGRSFSFIDPAKEFPGPNAEAQFCCDQVVNYIAAIDTFVWLLQYGPQSGDNFQRLAFAKSADVKAGRWRLFDLTTQALGVDGAFLDFPDLAVGANFLYVTTNVFAADGGTGAAVVRIAIADIADGPTSATPFVSRELNSFRVAQNCGKTAYFGAHQDTSTLSVFRWDENLAVPVAHAVGVARWIGGSGYQSRTPDGRRWLDRADPRITGATLAGDELWFAWGVDRGSNQRDKPFVQLARIDSRNMTLLENVNLFDVDSALCYAGLATNADNEVGVSYMIGGGSRFPSHAVGILSGTRQDLIAAAGERGPLDPETGKGEWGDYLSIRPVFPERRLFAAAGYTMRGAGDGSNRDATPELVIFGRARDTRATAPLLAGGRPRRPAIPRVADDGPITDVDTLPTVSAAVAARIKTAAGIGAAPAAPEAQPAPPVKPELVTKPGVERWPVKTGTDIDVALVGKNVIDGEDLGRGIVDATLEELVSTPRPADMPDPRAEPPGFENRRSQPVETTIWRIEAEIIALKLEADGDYHLVLQGASGETMIGEIPTPTREFIGDSPWGANIAAARQAADERLVSQVPLHDFVPMGNRLLPRAALSTPPSAPVSFPAQSATPGAMPLFRTRINPTRARLTGPGFFDRVHDQAGVSTRNGIEIHPVLKIEWL